MVWEQNVFTLLVCTIEGWMAEDEAGMGVSKPTEMTIRDLLQEELRKRGVTVFPEFFCFNTGISEGNRTA